MITRYGHRLEQMPHHRNDLRKGSEHQLNVGFTVSDAQLADDDWRSEFEDHRLDTLKKQRPKFESAGGRGRLGA